jgi:hypothetical protein
MPRRLPVGDSATRDLSCTQGRDDDQGEAISLHQLGPGQYAIRIAEMAATTPERVHAVVILEAHTAHEYRLD